MTARRSVLLAAVVFTSGVSEARADLDCSKEVASSADSAHCAEERLEPVLAQLKALNDELIGRFEGSSDLNHVDAKQELREATASWMTFAQKYCDATNGYGGGRWPDANAAYCMRDLVVDRIRQRCGRIPGTGEQSSLSECKSIAK